jgi:hypothetical protein
MPRGASHRLGDKNPDGSARQPRYGMMTMVAEKRAGTWLVAASQNDNSIPGLPPEFEGIRRPMPIPDQVGIQPSNPTKVIGHGQAAFSRGSLEGSALDRGSHKSPSRWFNRPYGTCNSQCFRPGTTLRAPMTRKLRAGLITSAARGVME